MPCIGDALADGFGDLSTKENRPREFEDCGEDNRLIDGEGLGSDRRRVSVGDIVCADTERGKKSLKEK